MKQRQNDETSASNAKASLPEEETEDTTATFATKMQLILLQLRTLKAKYPHYRIQIAGHSLGGALALLAALEVASDPFLSSIEYPVICMTFGNQPWAGKTIGTCLQLPVEVWQLRP